MTAALYNSFYSLGAIFSPIIGGYMSDTIGYRLTCDIMAIISAVYIILYMIFNTTLKDYKIFNDEEKEEEFNKEVDESVKKLKAKEEDKSEMFLNDEDRFLAI